MAEAVSEGYSYYYTCNEDQPLLHFSGWSNDASYLPSTYNSTSIPNGSVFFDIIHDRYYYYIYSRDNDGNLVGKWTTAGK